MFKYKKIIIAVSSILLTSLSYADSQNIPIGNSSFYYQIGGGDDFSLPATMQTSNLNLKADSSLDVGYGCDVFNPSVSIQSYFNNGQYQAEELEQNVIDNLTSAITEWPMYELSKIDPSLYNLISNNMLGANQTLSVGTKNCNDLKRQIDDGQNPYQDFAKVSVNHNFTKDISLAASNGDGDVVDTMNKVSNQGGDNGIPWVQGADQGNGMKMAGGSGQPVVHVIHDTAEAGYNVLLNRDVSDTSAPSSNSTNQYLLNLWPTPDDAASWLVQTIGDMNVTTCEDSSCDKSETPGHGLRYWVDVCNDANQDYCATNLTQKISDLVTGNTEINKDNLLAVSAPGVAINEAVIDAIKQMDSTTQSIMVNKLGQEVSAQKVFDMAMMARQILIAGADLPVIAADKPAQVEIHAGLKKLDDDIQSMTFEHNARKEMMSNTVSAILDYSNAQNAQSTSNPVSDSNPTPIMHDGAIISKEGATG